MKKSRLAKFVAAGFIVVAAIALRFWQLSTKPGWEMDEVVYNTITGHFVTAAYPWLKNNVPYLSHPPFFFELLRSWFSVFGVGIYQGRLFSAVSQLVSFGVLYFVARRLMGQKGALIGIIFVLFDGWLVYTARIGWMENSLLLLIVLSVWLYYEAVRCDSVLLTLLAGTILGFTVVYKHISLFMLLFVVIAWFFGGRKRAVQHIIILEMGVLTILIYIGYMLIRWDGLYVTQTMNQLARTLGLEFSPGLNYGLSDVWKALSSHYWMFFTDVAAFLIGVPWALWQIIKGVKGTYKGNTVILAWSAASIIFMGVISLKAPHYFILILVPLFTLIAANIELPLRKTCLILGVFVFLSLVTWTLRIANQHDNLLKEVQSYALSQIPPDAVVFTTEPICAIIPQGTCFKLEGQSDGDIAKSFSSADWVLSYTSTTQKFPVVKGGYLEASLSGFKDKLSVYRMK